MENQVTTVVIRADGTEEYTYGTVDAQTITTIQKTLYQRYHRAFIQLNNSYQNTAKVLERRHSLGLDISVWRKLSSR